MSAVPDFGASYDKARKAYGLSTAVLLAWEFIGIELGEAPIESLKITLKSPQAAPYVLLALVAYFGFRFSVEWFQTDQSRRRLLVSRVDFAIAHVLGLMALALYGVQTLLRVQVANAIQLQPSTATDMMLGFNLGLGLALMLILPHLRRSRVVIAFLASSVLIVLVKIAFGSVDFRILVGACLASLAINAGIQYFARRTRAEEGS
jgi:hypothetical protein